LLVRFSELVSEHCWIKELDINPLMASPEKIIALDARVVLFDKDVTEEQLPKLAVRPYPIQYVGTWTARDNTEVTIRPILPEDEPMLVNFHATLSDRTVYMRYLQPMLLQERVVHDRLSRICHGDYDREITLIAEKQHGDDSELLGVVRLSKIYGTSHARLSILVGDSFQGNGLGGELVRRAIDIAMNERLTRMSTTLTADNQAMLHIFQKLGFTFEPDREGKYVAATIEL
jgi:acetyltransferase